MAGYSLTDSKCLLCDSDFVQDQKIIYLQCAKVSRVRAKSRWIRAKYDPVTKVQVEPAHIKTLDSKVTHVNFHEWGSNPIGGINGPGQRGGMHVDCFKSLAQQMDIEDISVPLKERKAFKKERTKKPKPPRPGRLEHLDED
jgi:hypothetical protein